jgi:hypothetical protein
MAEAKEPIEITQYDVNEFAKKLEQWSNDLPPAEQAVLAAMISQASEIVGAAQEPVRPAVKFTVPLDSIVGRFIVDQGPERIFIKDPGPSWVNSPHKLGNWAEVVNPE